MNKQTGFTLIELIMVIVILGILSAFALPRFANLTDSASEAAVEGARASVASSSAIIHAAALVAGVSSDAEETVDIEGGTADLVYGYPAITSVSGFNIADVAQIGDFGSTSGTTTGSIPFLVVYSSRTTGEPCFVYTEATATGAPLVVTPPSISAVDTLTVDSDTGAFATTDRCGAIPLAI